ncbi:MAG: Asp-tRNA(Asn)/Glu-tRNA(Gln) amidotransferase subunit GatC [bacterium]|nr:Asp-tRNA(Asn)/Glu-tRNA(Gln) amidotransferase subunit GatC [bacterium]
MVQKITKKEVQKIALLSRLELSDEETEQYAKELSAILGYVDMLSEVDTENTEITSQVTGLSNVMREDVVRSFDNPKELISLAPEHQDNLVKVKAVFSS